MIQRPVPGSYTGQLKRVQRDLGRLDEDRPHGREAFVLTFGAAKEAVVEDITSLALACLKYFLGVVVGIVEETLV